MENPSDTTDEYFRMNGGAPTAVSAVERRAIEAALGLVKRTGHGRFSTRWSRKNFIAVTGREDILWQELVRKGFARPVTRKGRADGYSVTLAGMQAAEVMKWIPKSRVPKGEGNDV